jgi:hypothetical protein
MGIWQQLTIDCNDPALLVRFWAPVLDYEVQPPPDGFATMNDWYLSLGIPEDELDLTGDGTDRIFDPTGHGPRIWFQYVPEPKTVKNRLHLDLYPSGGRSVPLTERIPLVEAAVAELVRAGASIGKRFPADFGEQLGAGDDHYFVVMHDPEGNEFCAS